jgi:LmbE family N-acetylglucosaminyl deacetylase
MPSVIVIGSHSDDQTIGVAGTAAKLAAEGFKVYTFILSKGAQSHPHLKRSFIVKTRIQEAKAADEVIGGAGVKFFDLHENKFDKGAQDTDIVLQLSRAFDRLKPEKVFTHSEDDVHKDHRSTYRITLLAWENSKHKPAVYTYDIWNPWNYKGRTAPRMIVDISEQFDKKISALHCFRSQRVQALIPLMWLVYVRAIFHGFLHGVRYAEIFRRVR